MISNIYTKTLYQKRFMLLGWFLGITFMTFITLAFFNSFSSGALADSFNNLSPALQKVVGDAASFTTISGYISQQIFALRIPLLVIILSIAVLVGLSAGEEQQGLLETQLSLPISRTDALLQKLAAGLTVIVIGSFGALVGVAIGLLVIGQSYSLVRVIPDVISCALIAICYGLVGFTVAALTGRRGLALGISSCLAFLGYLINSMAASVSALATADKLTLFHYYHAKGSFDWSGIALFIGVAVMLVVISVIGFQRRDIVK